jgi:hypothetical protein
VGSSPDWRKDFEDWSKENPNPHYTDIDSIFQYATSIVKKMSSMLDTMEEDLNKHRWKEVKRGVE